MKNYRVYYQYNIEINKTIELPPNDSHYLIKVLRLKKDNQINIFNCQGEWLAKIIDDNKNKAKILVLQQIKTPPPLIKWIHLLYAPLKHIPTSFLITKATELGVNEITQVITNNTNNKPLEPYKITLKAKEAAEQCERLTLPTINHPTSLEKLITNLNFNLLWLNEQQTGEELNHNLLKNSHTNHINILIGPEGGFSKNEIALLNGHKLVTSVYLKGNILRAETAGLAALTLATYI